VLPLPTGLFLKINQMAARIKLSGSTGDRFLNAAPHSTQGKWSRFPWPPVLYLAFLLSLAAVGRFLLK